jgi:protein TonB
LKALPTASIDSIRIDWIEPVEVVPVPLPPIPLPPQRPVQPPRVQTQQPVEAVVFAESEMVIEAAPIESDVVEVSTAAVTASRGAQLAYGEAPPPPYPSIAQRRGWEGEVLLRVEVNASGRPESVEIARSSGHSVLDRAAMQQVLKRWRFQPALRNGQAIRAWAEVPVRFTLERG